MMQRKSLLLTTQFLKLGATLCVGVLLASCQGGISDNNPASITSARGDGGFGSNAGGSTETPIQSNPANPGGVPNGGFPGGGVGTGHR